MFSWSEAKAAENLRKHGIDFRDAIFVWQGVCLEERSDRGGEERHITIGMIDDTVVAVVWTPRDGGRRIISARRARKYEEDRYHDRLARRRPPG